MISSLNVFRPYDLPHLVTVGRIYDDDEWCINIMFE